MVKTAIVTGAANGIGKAISRRLKDDGCYIFAVDIDDGNGKSLINELGENFAEYVHCNVTSENEVEFLFKSAVSKKGKVDILINNAGILRDNMIHKMPIEDFDAVIGTNLKGTWLMCRAAAKVMKDQKSGRIVNISSRAWLGNPGQTNYSASKAGIIGLTRVLALELGKSNILVNALAPGLIDTPLTQSLPRDVLEKLILTQPTKTMGKPDDIANAVSFLVSEKTQFITGQVIYVDGGKSIGANLSV
ncbi:MAG: 3-oxoacyl-ACP reductase FabG [Ignavibacteria bacterium]|nr:3-oxoacyl-ACP reductase FabG [Ignavibacteria bacterium]MCC7158211.1 3-oxoacyl-ACP reductase FabG [Ignavibacteria bacterium]